MIMKQIKDAVAPLTESEKKELHILAISMDPEKDTPQNLKKMADAQNVSTPFFHFLTGDPKEVNKILDTYDFARTKDPKTGIISHANLFILIDRSGKKAYRFTLGKQQEKWQIEALKKLIKEEKNLTRGNM
jgi:protein SCO1/2